MDSGFDQNLYSRQAAVYGSETQMKLTKLNILLINLKGLGIEIAKNVVLAGPASLTIHDDNESSILDLAANFYLSEKDCKEKTKRSIACKEKLQNLNEYTKVSVLSGEISEQIIEKFNILIITDFYDKPALIKMNNICRAKGIGFIYACSLGLFGFTFVDFGKYFTVNDSNGEEGKSFIVTSISREKEGIVAVHDDKRHNFTDGDSVTFKEVEGMVEVNNNVFKVKYLSPYTFTIGDTSSFSPYSLQGIVTEVKVPKQIKFKSLEEALIDSNNLNNVEPYIPDFAKYENYPQFHLAINSILNFFTKYNKLPGKQTEFEWEKFLDEVNTTNEFLKSNKGSYVDSVNKELLKKVIEFSDLQISPVVSFWGGIIAQEVVKFTGKFSPIQQWLSHDFFESLPEDAIIKREAEGDRYDAMRLIYGNKVVNDLHKLKILLVGAGALGCELLKLFALSGISCSTEGFLKVTDDDNIEFSNLNRQFLFRKSDIGKSKSMTAFRASRDMNNKLNGESLKIRVCPETETVFDENFWMSLDCVVNAVDNVKARQYIDSQCVIFNKPLFDSGTLGTKCNSQVVLPKLTQSYNDTIDPPEDSIAMCTLKNFPHQIEHTIEWARDYFEGTFVEASKDFKEFSLNPKDFLENLKKNFEKKYEMFNNKLKNILVLYEASQKNSKEICIQMARDRFEEIFNHQILQLLALFPKDLKSEGGLPYWSGPKRAPTEIHFNAEDKMHLQFLLSFANLFAFIIGVERFTDINEIKQIVANCQVEEFKLPTMKKISDNEISVADDEMTQKIILENYDYLSKVTFEKGSDSFKVIEFEKDDDKNFHIDAIAAVANLRARNYNIPEVDNTKVKLIAGKIVPAIATTTATIVGAVGIEIIKLVQNKTLSSFKSSFINLAFSSFVFIEPSEVIRMKDKEFDPIMFGPVKAIPKGFTKWDSITVRGSITIAEFLRIMKAQYDIEVNAIGIGKLSLFSRLNKNTVDVNLEERLLNMGGTLPTSRNFVLLEIWGSDKDGVDVVTPKIKYYIR